MDIVATWLSTAAGGVERTASLQWLFAAQLPAGAQVRLPAEELAGWEWAPRIHLAQMLPDRIARRVVPGWIATLHGATYYLENGYPRR